VAVQCMFHTECVGVMPFFMCISHIIKDMDTRLDGDFVTSQEYVLALNWQIACLWYLHSHNENSTPLFRNTIQKIVKLVL
jgi:hypothetical protein